MIFPCLKSFTINLHKLTPLESQYIPVFFARATAAVIPDDSSSVCVCPLDTLVNDLTTLNKALYTFEIFGQLPEFHRFYKASRLPMLSKQVISF